MTGHVEIERPVLAGDVMTASRTMGGWRDDRRLVAAAVALATIWVWAVAGRDVRAAGLSPTPDRSPSPTPAVVAVVTAERGSDVDPAGAGIVTIEKPAAGDLVRSSTIDVGGLAEQPIPRARLSVRLGTSTLGSVETTLRRGVWEVRVPVFAPPTPIPVDVLVERGDPGGWAVIGRTTVRLAARSPVEVWSVSRSPAGGSCMVAAAGFGPAAAEHLDVSLVEDDRAIAMTVAPVRLDPATSGSVLFRIGRWEAALPMSPSALAQGAPQTRLGLGWTDPTDGTSGSASIPIQFCSTDERAS